MTTDQIIEKYQPTLDGVESKNREYIICLGQSNGSKGVMFVLYCYTKPDPTSDFRPMNPMNYMGQLADDLENAIIKARERCGSHKILIEDDKTARDRKDNILEIPFGKYKGRLLTEIIDEDVNYIYWLANNGTFKSKGLREAMDNYRDIARDIISENNAKTELAPLEVEKTSAIKELKVVKATNLGYECYRTTLIDEIGNRYVYKGKFLGDKDQEIEFKCRVKYTNTYLGRTYNNLGIRNGK